MLTPRSFKFKGPISRIAHVRAEAQNVINSAEYFKIDAVKKRWRPPSGFGSHGDKRRNSGENYSTNDSGLRTDDAFSAKIIYFTRGLQEKYEARYEPSSDSDFAAHYLLNI